MTSAEFRAARKSLGLTQAALAEALDMSRTQIVDYEAGINHKTKLPIVIPRVVELACEALALRGTGKPGECGKRFSAPNLIRSSSLIQGAPRRIIAPP